MKKFILLCLFLIFSLPLLSIPKKETNAESSPIFAKINYENVYFFSLPSSEEENKLFVLPKTYFVKLLASENDEFYYAQYDDIFGYVPKTALLPMNGIPTKPYATSTFRVFSMEGLGLYKNASMSTQKLADIPYLSEELTYYGIMQGEEVIPEKTNEWYYAKYSKTGALGYVYSVFCDSLAKIEDNTETFEIIKTPIFVEDVSGEELSSVAMTFIIIGVSLPCLIVLYLLVKPTMFKEKITREKPKLRSKGNRDYFEFDEADLN